MFRRPTAGSYVIARERCCRAALKLGLRRGHGDGQRQDRYHLGEGKGCVGAQSTTIEGVSRRGGRGGHGLDGWREKQKDRRRLKYTLHRLSIYIYNSGGVCMSCRCTPPGSVYFASFPGHNMPGDGIVSSTGRCSFRCTASGSRPWRQSCTTRPKNKIPATATTTVLESTGRVVGSHCTAGQKHKHLKHARQKRTRVTLNTAATGQIQPAPYPYTITTHPATQQYRSLLFNHGHPQQQERRRRPTPHDGSSCALIGLGFGQCIFSRIPAVS